MNRINIRGKNEIDDPFYRYKRDRVITQKLRNKVEIANLTKISKDIERDPDILISYLKLKFNSNFIDKNNKITTTKNLENSQIESVINDFIQEYVLCEKCLLPETDLLYKDTIYLNCRCCSHLTKKNPDDKIIMKFINNTIKSG